MPLKCKCVSASAVFLILELNAPFTGLFRIPAASIEQTIRAVGG